jgi:hypothetical protein
MDLNWVETHSVNEKLEINGEVFNLLLLAESSFCEKTLQPKLESFKIYDNDKGSHAAKYFFSLNPYAFICLQEKIKKTAREYWAKEIQKLELSSEVING